MSFLEFLISILWLISIDLISGFLIFLLWRYLDEKYFSRNEINILKQENDYLKNENKKLGGVSSKFWKEG